MPVVICADISGAMNAANHALPLRGDAEISSKSTASQWLWSLGMIVAAACPSHRFADWRPTQRTRHENEPF